MGGDGSSVPRGILSTTCSDRVHSAASYPPAGAVIPNLGRAGENVFRDVCEACGGSQGPRLQELTL